MDEHIDRLIYQTLNVPSFVGSSLSCQEFPYPQPTPSRDRNTKIWRLINHVKSTRSIVVITGGSKVDGQYKQGAGTLQDFATTVMPDITELDIEARVSDKARRADRPEQEVPLAE